MTLDLQVFLTCSSMTHRHPIFLRLADNIIVWGLHKELTTLEVRAKFADMGLESFVRGNVLWEGDHIRLVLTKKDSKGVSSELVKQVTL